MLAFHDKNDGVIFVYYVRGTSGAAPIDSPSILEGVPEGQGSNMRDWPPGHPCGIKNSWGFLPHLAPSCS
jgi:hypothetical protein